MFSFLPDTFGFRTLGRTCFFFGRHGAYLAKSHFPQTATRFKSLVRQINVKFTPVPTIFPSQTRKSCKILTGTGTVKNLANLEGKTVLTEFWSYIYYLNVKPRCGVQVEMWTRGVREGRTSVFVLLHTVFSIPICWYNQWVWRLIVALLIVANLSGVLKPRLHTTRELVLFVNMTVLLQITRVGKAFTTVWLATLPDQNIIAFFFVIFFVFAPFFFQNLEVALRKRAVNNQERNCLVLLFMPLTSRCPCPYFLNNFFFNSEN